MILYCHHRDITIIYQYHSIYVLFSSVRLDLYSLLYTSRIIVGIILYYNRLLYRYPGMILYRYYRVVPTLRRRRRPVRFAYYIIIMSRAAVVFALLLTFCRRTVCRHSARWAVSVTNHEFATIECIGITLYRV